MQLRLLFLLFLLAIVSSLPAQNFVFPGDADRNGRVDHLDVLAIGFAYGQLGPARVAGNQNEPEEIVANWPGVFPNGVNYIHADANGNGLIDLADFLVLAQNDGLTHPDSTNFFSIPLAGNFGIPPGIQAGTGTNLNPNSIGGNTLSIPIQIDYEQNDAWINGLAFTLNVNADLVESATFEFSDEWLGAAGEAFKFQRQNDGEFRIALTRFGSNPVTSDGKVGTLNIVIIEDLIGLMPVEPGQGENLVTIDAVQGISGDFEAITFEATHLKIDPVNAQPVSVELPVSANAKMLIYPNPSHGQFTVESDVTFELIELIDVNGRNFILYQGPASRRQTLSGLHFSPGVYFLRSSHKGGVSIQPIVLE